MFGELSGMGTAPTRHLRGTASVNRYAVNRMASYVVAGMVAVLLPATISQRLVSADQAWMYLSLGGGLGALIGGIVPLMRLLPSGVRWLSGLVFFLIALVLSLLVLTVVHLVGMEISLSWMGVAFGALTVGSFGLFLYCLLDTQHA